MTSNFRYSLPYLLLLLTTQLPSDPAPFFPSSLLSLIQSGGADSELDIERLKKWGFCSCNCRIYLHYLWCVHVCTDGLVKKLILKFPKAYSVKRLGVEMDGRACKALRGGALGYQQWGANIGSRCCTSHSNPNRKPQVSASRPPIGSGRTQQDIPIVSS